MVYSRNRGTASTRAVGVEFLFHSGLVLGFVRRRVAFFSFVLASGPRARAFSDPGGRGGIGRLLVDGGSDLVVAFLADSLFHDRGGQLRAILSDLRFKQFIF